MSNYKQEISDIIDTVANPNTPTITSHIQSLSPAQNLFATMVAMGTIPHIAYEQAIQSHNPAYYNKNEKSKKSDTTRFISKHPNIAKAITEYKGVFIKQYTETLQINKHTIISEIKKLSELAKTNLDLKTSLECLKTIGSELGMFQKNLKIEHSVTETKANIIELVQANIPEKSID